MKRIEVCKCDWCDKTYSSKKCVEGENFHSKNLSIADALDFLAKLGMDFLIK